MKKQILFVLIIVSSIVSCKSTGSDRIKKDIIGINEQLYELEKNQITIEENLITLTKNKAVSEKSKAKEMNNDKSTLYSTGYKFFLEENYSKAIPILKKIILKYSNDKLVDNSLFWLAESYLKINNLKSAINYYKLIYRYFPFSEKADYALFKIGYIYYKQKNYSKADLAYYKLLKEYPYSDFKRSTLNYRKKIKKNRRRK